MPFFPTRLCYLSSPLPGPDKALAGRRRPRFRWERVQDGVEEVAFRQCPLDKRLFVDDGLRDRENAVFFRNLGKLRHLDAVRLDMGVLDGEPLREAHGLRAVRSGRGDEHFQVDGLRDFRELLAGLGGQPRVAVRHGEDSVEQHGELVAGRKAVKADAVVL